jgi:signal transduction histidine kinase
VSLRVHNVGPPIPRERLEVIFEPFRRADEHTKSGDSFGLGLYIVKEIIAAHGGTIDVRSLDPAGTTFTIRLPRGEATEDALTA